jgi:hypothetical protein
MFSRFFNTRISPVLLPARDISVVVERTFVGQFIDVALTPRYEKCRFDRCTFLWSGHAWRAVIFTRCNFEDCDLGMQDDRFLALTVESTIKRRQKLIANGVLDQAVKHVARMGIPLDGAALVAHVATEYRRLLAKAGFTNNRL